VACTPKVSTQLNPLPLPSLPTKQDKERVVQPVPAYPAPSAHSKLPFANLTLLLSHHTPNLPSKPHTMTTRKRKQDTEELVALPSDESEEEEE
jgi:hypothetical protein